MRITGSLSNVKDKILTNAVMKVDTFAMINAIKKVIEGLQEEEEVLMVNCKRLIRDKN